MSFLRRLLGRAASPPQRQSADGIDPRRVNLVDEDLPTPLPPPPNLGIQAIPQAMPWTAARLERIVRRANANPVDAQFLLEARHARHCLSRFWLQAPIDQLETLYAGPIGQVQRMLLHGVLPAQPLAADEENWRQLLSNALVRDFGEPERLNLLLAVMPYCQRGSLRVSNPLETLPAWLLGDYASCFDSSLAGQLGQPVGLLDQPTAVPPLASAAAGTASVPAAAVPSPAPAAAVPAVAEVPAVTPSSAGAAPPTATEAASLPKISQNSGRDGFNLLQQPDVLERMQGLINLYTADRSDRELRGELAALRRLLAQIWLDVTPGQIEELYRSTNVGAVYRALLASNFGGDELDPDEVPNRDALMQVAQDLNHPGFLQAMLAVMLYFPQGRMELGDLRDRLPGWFQQEFPRLAGV